MITDHGINVGYNLGYTIYVSAVREIILSIDANGMIR